MPILSFFVVLSSSLGLVVKQPGAANPLMPTVNHDKEAGSGYSPGSPLFRKQEEAQTAAKNGTGAATPAAKATPAATTTTIAGGAQSTSAGTSARSAVHAFLGNLIYVILVLVIAYIYKRYKKETDSSTQEPSEGGSFTFGLFDVQGCQTDTQLCLCSFCCPCIRWAETMSSEKVNFLRFWTAMALVLGLHLLSGPTAGLAALVSLGGAIFFRQRLRDQFGHDPKTAKTIILDILTWCCCPLCAIAQEAREVEHCKPRKVA